MSTRTRRRLTAALALVVLVLVATANSCDSGTTKKNSANNRTETEAIASSFRQIHESNPIKVFKTSQEYDTLQDVLTLRAEGTHGTAVVTTFDGTLLWWCPTLGAPIPSTYQISNPSAFVDPPDKGGQTDVLVAQGEPTGVYPGDSTATWVLCLDDHGTPFGQYDEANIRWTSGIVEGLPADKRARVDEITFEFTQNDNSE
jgi:hypothetical protein